MNKAASTQDDRKQLLKDTFDTVADGYDARALRFFSTSAVHMAERLGNPIREKSRESRRLGSVLAVLRRAGHVAGAGRIARRERLGGLLGLHRRRTAAQVRIE